MDHVENNSKPHSHVSYTLKPNPREWTVLRSSRECRIVSENTQRSTERVRLFLFFKHLLPSANESTFVLTVVFGSSFVREYHATSADFAEIDDDESEPASVPEGKNPERPVPKAPNANPPENSPVLGVTPGEFPSKGTSIQTSNMTQLTIRRNQD